MEENRGLLAYSFGWRLRNIIRKLRLASLRLRFPPKPLFSDYIPKAQAEGIYKEKLK